MINPRDLYNKYKSEVHTSLSEREFHEILSEINLFYEVLLLKGEKVHLGNNNGAIEIKNKKVTQSLTRINWGESNKLKNELIANGKTPYYKSEEEDAKSKGIRYEGIKWHIYNEEPVVPYVNWNKPNTIPCYITCTYNHSNNTGHTPKQLEDTLSNDEILYNEQLGITRKLRLLINKNKTYINTFADDIQLNIGG